MTLPDHPLQRIPIRGWSLSLSAGKKTAPRFQLGIIQGVTFRTYLKEYRIDAICLEGIQLKGEHFLNFSGGLADKLAIDTLYPGSPELSLVLREKGQTGKTQ
jgi:hypothetical protein